MSSNVFMTHPNEWLWRVLSVVSSFSSVAGVPEFRSMAETWPMFGPKTCHELVMNLKNFYDASWGSMNYRLGKSIG